MINDELAAKEVIALTVQFRTDLIKTIDMVATGEQEDLQAYKRAVGYLLFNLFEQVLEPLFRVHPELMPEEYRSWLPADWARRDAKDAGEG